MADQKKAGKQAKVGMIAENCSVYNSPYRWKDMRSRVLYWTVLCYHHYLVPCFLLFCYPYISLHC